MVSKEEGVANLSELIPIAYLRALVNKIFQKYFTGVTAVTLTYIIQGATSGCLKFGEIS